MSRVTSQERRAPKGMWSAAWTALIVLSISSILTWAPGTAGAISVADVDDDVLVASVDIDRMMRTVEALQAFGSREFHLESSRQAAEFLYEEFEEIGMPVEYQYFMVEDTQVANVVATLQGSDGEAGMYLFGAHYDSENREVSDLSSAENMTAPGADDDASGVAAVLEMARVLESSGFPATVKFVMFGAEEYGYDDTGGCRGSQHFAAQEASLGHVYSGTAALDMIGYRDGDVNKAVLVVNDDGYVLADSTSKAVDRFGTDLDLEVLVDHTITYSDHSSFWGQGMPSMLVVEELDNSFFPVNPSYHTSYDTADRLSTEQLEAVTEALLGGLLLVDDGDDTLLIFGIAIISVAIVSVVLFIHIRRKRGGS